MTQDEMKFIENLFRSLESEMNHRFEAMSQEVNQRFDKNDARLDLLNARMDRIGGLVNGGSRALARLAEWSERQDQFQVNTSRSLADLDARLRRLESDKEQH